MEYCAGTLENYFGKTKNLTSAICRGWVILLYSSFILLLLAPHGRKCRGKYARALGALMVLEATGCLPQTYGERTFQLQLCRTGLRRREPVHCTSVNQPPSECSGSASLKVMLNPQSLFLNPWCLLSLFLRSAVSQASRCGICQAGRCSLLIRSHLQRAHARFKPILCLFLCDACICLVLCLGIWIVYLGWALSYMFNPGFFALLQGLAVEQEVNGVSGRDDL